MNRKRSLGRLVCSVTLLVILLSVLSISLSSQPVAQAAGKKKVDTARVFGARPLWKYAKKVSKTSASSDLIPPCLGSSELPRCYSPQQIRRAYAIQPLLNRGISGKGRTIVIIGGSSSPTLNADLQLYNQLYGLHAFTLNVIAPFGMPPFDSAAYLEAALDIETAHAIAPGATIDLVLANTSLAQTPGDFASILLNATKYAVDNNLGDVISQSFGVGETCVDPAYIQAETAVFRAARAKNITVLASAGDSGAGEIICKGSDYSVGAGVPIPAANPLVTSVGGTTLIAEQGTGKYISETTWNEWSNGGGATGGGPSQLFARPDYQSALPSAPTKRSVPDVAYLADPFTGVPVVVSLDGQTLIVPVGGTSVGAPSWAGIVALADQYAGRRLGFLNASLYRIAASAPYSAGFHDITSGNNTISTYNEEGEPITIEGYSAKARWDAVTGVGTPKVNGLLPLLQRYQRAGDGDNL